MKKILVLFFVFVFVYSSVKCQNLMDMDKPDNYVVDLEYVFTPEEKADLISLMKDYEAKTSIQFCVATSADFDFMYSTELARQWKIGQKGINNGFVIIFSKTQRHIEYRTGYGLEEFLTDGWLSNYKDTELIPTYFKNELYYDGLRAFIIASQNKIGFEGYDFLIKNKERKAAEHKAVIYNFFSNLFYVLLGLILLAGIGYLIYTIYERKQKYLALKTQFDIILFDIEQLYSLLIRKLPSDLEHMCDNRIINPSKKFITEDIKKNSRLRSELINYNKLIISVSGIIKDIKTIYSFFSVENIKIPEAFEYDLIMDTKIITTETRVELHLLYNKLLVYKKLVLDIDECIKYIEDKKIEVSRYFKNDYQYCKMTNKSELNIILNIIQINTEYTKENLVNLTKIKNSVDFNFDAFLNKLNKIDSIINDKQKNNQFDLLKKSYLKYVETKNFLSKVKIGNRYNLLKNINIDDVTNSLTSDLNNSVKLLTDDKFNDAVKFYDKYLSDFDSIYNEFDIAEKLFEDYNSSSSSINYFHEKINEKISNIDRNINDDGVLSSRKTTYNNLKSKTHTFMNVSIVDVIDTAETLKTIIDELDILLRSIIQDIQNEIDRVRKEQEREREEKDRRIKEENDRVIAAAAAVTASYSYNNDSYSGSSDSNFSSGGGDFGGGGGGGSW